MCTPLGKPTLICDRGAHPLIELSMDGSVCLMVIRHVSGAECEFVVPRRLARIVALLAIDYERDVGKREAQRGFRRGASLATEYAAVLNTRPPEPGTIYHYVRKLRRLIDEAVAGIEGDAKSWFASVEVIETTQSGYRIGAHGLVLFAEDGLV